jgi:MFS family permease
LEVIDKFASLFSDLIAMDERIWSRDYILLILSNFLMYIVYYAILSALPVYLVSDLHATKFQVGVVVGAYTVASVLVRPFSGFALDRFGRRTILLLGLVFYTALISGYLVALTIAALIILRVAQGLVWAFTTVSGSTIAVDITVPEKRGEGIGYHALSTTLGMSVGPVIGLFICHHWGYMTMFIAGILISLASLFSAVSVRLPKKIVSGNRIPFEWGALFERNSVLPSVNVFITMIAYGGMMSFVALYGLEIGIHNSSFYFLVLSIGIAAARIIIGKEFDRNGPRKILTVCMMLLIAGFPVLGLARNGYLFYGSALIIGFGNGVIFPTFQSMINNIADPARRGSANSTLYTAVDLGMGIGMIMGGFIAQHYSMRWIFFINGVLCLSALLFFNGVVLRFYDKAVRKNSR